MPPTQAEPPKRRRIGVLTSGGDAPGMNGAVRAVVRMALYSDCEAYTILEGYEGLVNGGDMIRRVQWEDVRGWLSCGGTLIGSARSMSFRERPGRMQAAKNMVLRGIDALIVCGGDGSLTGADVFRGEWPALLDELIQKGELTKEQVEPYRVLNIVGLVGSIDNDMSGTDATIGCYSSLTRICDAVDDVFDTAFSHQRGFVIEVMGRHCGWLALMSAISTGADWLFIPENPPRDGWEDEMCANIVKVGLRTLLVYAFANWWLRIEPERAWKASDNCHRRRRCPGPSSEQNLQQYNQGHAHQASWPRHQDDHPRTHPERRSSMCVRPVALDFAGCGSRSRCFGHEARVAFARHHHPREQDHAHAVDGGRQGNQGSHFSYPQQGL